MLTEFRTIIHCQHTIYKYIPGPLLLTWINFDPTMDK